MLPAREAGDQPSGQGVAIHDWLVEWVDNSLGSSGSAPRVSHCLSHLCISRDRQGLTLEQTPELCGMNDWAAGEERFTPRVETVKERGTVAPACGGRDSHCSPVLCASLYLPSPWQLGGNHMTRRGQWLGGKRHMSHGQASDALFPATITWNPVLLQVGRVTRPRFLSSCMELTQRGPRMSGKQAALGHEDALFCCPRVI